MTREQLAELLGISGQVYGRYERAESKINVTRLIHLSEILGFAPIEMIYAAAPHLFGKTPKEAENRIRLMRLMSRMRPEAVELAAHARRRIVGRQRGFVGRVLKRNAYVSGK